MIKPELFISNWDLLMNKTLKKICCRFLLTLISVLFLFTALPAMATAPQKTDTAAGEKAVAQKNQILKKGEQEKIIDRIRQKYSRKQAFAGRFTQKTIYTDSDETTLSLGRLWIKGPDKMRWEYQSPEQQILVSDGKTIWYYTPDLNQVMVGKVDDIREARVPVNLMAKLQLKQKGFHLELSRSKDLITVSLTPVADDKTPPFQSMAMIFSASDYSLQETRMEDLFANKIVISYAWENTSHPALPGVEFSFKPPAGCDVMPLGK